MKIQPLEHKDLNLIMHLQPKDWPDIMPIIESYTDSNHCFPLKVIIDKKIAGIGTSIIHNDVAWLAHIIVHPDNRNQGIGKLITKTLVESLQAKNCKTIYLIATNLGEPIYEKVGFETETEYLFFKDMKATGASETSKNIVPFSVNLKNQIFNLDQRVSGENRISLYDKHLPNGFAYLNEGKVEGFYLPTFGEGLIIAISNSAGEELMKLRLSTKENVVFPIENICATEFMLQNNYVEFKRAKRMRFGQKRNWQPKNIYNRIGGNLG